MDWYPWYYTLYEQDTMHLNPYQDGCYRRLIDHYMKTRSPLPDNDAALARIVGDSEANWVALASPIVRPFFTASEGRLFLKRCDDILSYQDKLAKKLSESGKKGAEIRHRKAIENKGISSPPKATLKGSRSTIQYNTDYKSILPPIVPQGDDGIEKDFEDLWQKWKPFDMPKGNKQSALKSYTKHRKAGTPKEEIISGVSRYLSYCHGKQSKTQHVVTWLNQAGWTGDYDVPNSDDFPEKKVEWEWVEAPEGYASLNMITKNGKNWIKRPKHAKAN